MACVNLLELGESRPNVTERSLHARFQRGIKLSFSAQPFRKVQASQNIVVACRVEIRMNAAIATIFARFRPVRGKKKPAIAGGLRSQSFAYFLGAPVPVLVPGVDPVGVVVVPEAPAPIDDEPCDVRYFSNSSRVTRPFFCASIRLHWSRIAASA